MRTGMNSSSFLPVVWIITAVFGNFALNVLQVRWQYANFREEMIHARFLTEQSRIPGCTAPIPQSGSWIGDTWIPPEPWKLFSAYQIRRIFRDRSVLWVGDSTTRRAATTLYTLLNSTSEPSNSDLDSKEMLGVNKKEITEPCDRNTTSTYTPTLCRPMPGNAEKDYIVYRAFCYSDVELMINDELSGVGTLTKKADTLVVGLGVWYAARPIECADRRDKYEVLNDTLRSITKLAQARPDLTIVWRSSGYSDSHAREVLDEINQRSRAFIENSQVNNLKYLDWAAAVESRSFGDSRISGDISTHYGLQPRLVLAQMIANTLKDVEICRQNQNKKQLS